MEFTFETNYNQKSLTAMARVLRKTIRKKRSKRSHIFGWIIVVLSTLLTLASWKDGIVFSGNTIITILAILMILIVLFWEDAINGYVARKRMLPGTEKGTTVFDEEGYHSTSEVGESKWHYDKINIVAETAEYFVFVFSISHAQVFDKSSITGGTVEEFGRFIAEMTGKEVQRVK